jgi:hypothetical protein
MLKSTLNSCRSFQFGREKYLTPWLLVIGRKQVPMLEVTLVSFLVLNLNDCLVELSIFSSCYNADFVFHLHIFMLIYVSECS